MSRIAVLGASFNPPTRGHEDVVNQLLPQFDEIVLIPSVAHAFGKSFISLHHRLEMLKLFTAPSWEGRVTILNIEETLQQRAPNKPVYTYDVLCELDKIYQANGKQYSLHFIIGPDNASPAIWQKFYRYQDIETRWNVFVVKENVAIHSTSVRELVSSSLDLDKDTLFKKLVEMVSEPIANYILNHNLYCKKDPIND